MNKTHITLHLNHFYRDHRAISRLSLKPEFKTIKDLQEYIGKSFAIDNFYLTNLKAEYLPDFEDINIITSGEIIFVFPHDPSPQASTTPKKQNKLKRKKINNSIDDGIASTSNSKKSKNDQRISVVGQNITYFENLSSEAQTSTPVAAAMEISEGKDISREFENELASIVKETSTQYELSVKSTKPTKDKSKSSKSEDAGFTNEKKSKKGKIHSVETSQQDPVCNLSSKLLAQNYTPARNIQPTGSISKKINVVQNIMTKYTHEDLSFEKSKSLENCVTKSIDIQFSNETNITTAYKNDPQLEKFTDNSINHLDNMFEKSGNGVASSTDVDTNSNINYFIESENCQGLNCKEDSSHTSSQTDDFSSLNNFIAVPKRVRIRKRAKKQRNHVDSPIVHKQSSIVKVYKPLNILAKPLIHKRFDEEVDNFELMENAEDLPSLDIEKDMNIDTEHDTEKDNNGLDNKINGNVNSSTVKPPIQLTESVISKCQVMDKMQLQEMDNIVFRMLKLDEKCNPVISGFITGEVKAFDVNTEEVYLLINEGLEEFREPVTPFSIYPEGEEETQMPDRLQSLKWSRLIAPRLLNI